MGDSKLLGTSHLDGLTLTATSEAGTYLASNLLNVQPGRIWRSTSTAAQTITADLGEDKRNNAFCIYAHNLSNDGTASVRLTLSNDAAHTDIVYDNTVEGTDPLYGWGEGPYGMEGYGGYSSEGWAQPFTVIWLGDVYVARYFRVIITDTANADGYIQAGRIKLGQSIDIPVVQGYSMGWDEQTELTRTRGGALRSDSRDPFRYASATSAVLDKIQEGDVLEVFRSVGRRGDVLWSAFPDDATAQTRRNTILGRLTDYGSADISYVGSTVQFTIEEGL
jgi:hypothetical protein